MEIMFREAFRNEGKKRSKSALREETEFRFHFADCELEYKKYIYILNKAEANRECCISCNFPHR
jgi:hypothetical protein